MNLTVPAAVAALETAFRRRPAGVVTNICFMPTRSAVALDFGFAIVMLDIAVLTWWPYGARVRGRRSSSRGWSSFISKEAVWASRFLRLTSRLTSWSRAVCLAPMGSAAR